eukprot:TRINITY_DN4136_c0_g1_i10.p1 TRINITY_DN4136_c0_g1~~TRINITY_DN4136_c0_g1_i10.p1  ORF type:complete len:142 (-),score=15.61 TRINITY_DN4136_c0_g1_i10:6-431(-)
MDGLPFSCVRSMVLEDVYPTEVHFRAACEIWDVNIIVLTTASCLPGVSPEGTLLAGICTLKLHAISGFSSDRRTVLLHRRSQCDNDGQHENGHYEPVKHRLADGSWTSFIPWFHEPQGTGVLGEYEFEQWVDPVMCGDGGT